MDTNRTNLDVLFEQMKVGVLDGFDQAVPKRILEQCAMTVPSTTAATLHAWLTQIPSIREWIGDRVVNNIESDDMVIKNKKFEGTIEMPREDIEDDQYGLYKPVAQTLGMRAAEHPDKLIVEQLTTNPVWKADNAAFFGTTRKYGENTISNYVTSALAEGTFNTGITALQSYVGHNGETLGVEPFALLTGPALRTTAFDLCKNDFTARLTATAATYVQGQNPNKGLVLPVISNRLVGTYANYWFLLGQVGTIRGAVYQERMKPEVQGARMSLESDYVFENDKFQMGVRSRGAAFLALPHLIYAGYV
jgi:phage major head subunit gpT-like protein